MCMDDDLSLPTTRNPGDEREEIIHSNNFCLSYIDYYNDKFPQRHFTINGIV